MERLVVRFFVLLMLVSTPAYGGWFDIGSSDTSYVYANEDPGSWERYPPQPFGPTYPLGTLVYEDMSVVGCEVLPAYGQTFCGSLELIRAFFITFYDGGCGCGGLLTKPTTIKLRYDEAVVASRGVEESQLRLIYVDATTTTGWTLLPDAVADTVSNSFTMSWFPWVFGDRYFAIVTMDVTPARERTWGEIKARYRE